MRIFWILPSVHRRVAVLECKIDQSTLDLNWIKTHLNCLKGHKSKGDSTRCRGGGENKVQLADLYRVRAGIISLRTFPSVTCVSWLPQKDRRGKVVGRLNKVRIYFTQGGHLGTLTYKQSNMEPNNYESSNQVSLGQAKTNQKWLQYSIIVNPKKPLTMHYS